MTIGLRALALGALGAAALASGCRTLDRFDTDGNDAYCGSVVSSGFIIQGFDPELQLSVRIDTDHLASVPGTLTSNDAGKTGTTCAPLFSDTPMIVSETLNHDQLSTFDFGVGRDHNIMAWVESCDGQMLSVLSLMKNDDVEVRLMKPPGPPVAGAKPDTGGFALFQLARKEGGCGF